MNKCAIYCRVSTSDQIIDNQLDVLRDVARMKGLTIVKEFVDEGISGTTGRDKRKGFDELLRGAVKREFTSILVWSVDRIGRNIQDLLSFLNDVHSVDCDLYLHTQGIDTSTPTGKMMFGILSVLADWERGMIRERTQAGIERARKQGKKIGRPSNINEGLIQSIKYMRGNGLGIRRIARELSVGVGTVYKVIELR